MADKRSKRIAELIEPLRVVPGKKVNLPGTSIPAIKPASSRRKTGLSCYSRVLTYCAVPGTAGGAGHIWRSDVLAGYGCRGKDGTIRHVMSGVNPQGVHVSSFKVPSDEELNHDFLWRYSQRLPQRGEIGIFNRSHYEEVLVVRVHSALLEHQRLPREARAGAVWARRFREINDWEHYLVDNGFVVVKMFLNLSKEEQRKRFLKRVDLPDKNWEFSANDAKERVYWDQYQKAFSEMLSNTSTAWAPW